MPLSSEQIGALVPSSLLNAWHTAHWPVDGPDGRSIVTQDFRVVAADRPDLFPEWAPTAFRLPLGGLIVFARCPLE